MVVVGRIVRPQGHRGQVLVAPETDFPERRYETGATLYAKGAAGVVPLQIASSRPHQGRWVIAFGGVETMNEAEAWRNVELRVPESALQPLAAGTFWVHELVGCEVVTVRGERIGQVARVDLATGVPMLVLDAAGEPLIPFVDAICRSVDVGARMIRIDPPDGLIELNRKQA